MITAFQEQLVELQTRLVELEKNISVAIDTDVANSGEINLTADQEQALGALLVEQSDLIERIKTFLHKLG